MIRERLVSSTLEEDLSLLGLELTEASTKVQSLLFGKDAFTVPKAKKWAASHGFKSGKVDVKPDTIRLRQKDPEAMKKKSFRTITLRPGVKAVIGKNESINEDQTYTFGKLELKPDLFDIDFDSMDAESSLIVLDVMDGEKNVGKIKFKIALKLEVEDGIVGVADYDINLVDDGVLNLTKDYVEKYFNTQIWDFLDNVFWDVLQNKYTHT